MGQRAAVKNEMQQDCRYCLHLRPLAAFNVFQDGAEGPSI